MILTLSQIDLQLQVLGLVLSSMTQIEMNQQKTWERHAFTISPMVGIVSQNFLYNSHGRLTRDIWTPRAKERR